MPKCTVIGKRSNVYGATYGEAVELDAERAEQLARDGVVAVDGGVEQVAEAPSETEGEQAEAGELPMDVVVAVATQMIDEGDELTMGGKPELPALRKRISDEGYDGNALTSDMRDQAYDTVTAQ